MTSLVPPKGAGLSTISLTEQVAAKLTNLYILYYRHGSNPNCTKVFVHNGDIKSAAKRGRDHCDIMGYRIIFVLPFIRSLEDDERRLAALDASYDMEGPK